MKSLIAFLFILLCVCNKESMAQTLDCRIAYSYDNAGNRIKRQYKCEDPNAPTDPFGLGTHIPIATLNPNPTSGPFDITFSSQVASAHIFITDIGGLLIETRDITQSTSVVHFDITPVIPGTYIVTIVLDTDMESYELVKL